MNLLQRSIIAILSIPLFLGLVACKKDDSPLKGSSSTNGSTPAIDTTQKAKEVEVTEKDHRILFRPQANTSQRFRVRLSEQSAISIEDNLMGQPSGKHSASNSVEYYIRQTIRSVKADSSVDVSYRIDSVVINSSQDTLKVSYSSGNAADLKNPKFAQANSLVKQDFGVIVSNVGDIKEIYGYTGIVDRAYQSVPDSLKSADIKQYLSNQIKTVLFGYVQPVLAHFPAKPLAKDSSWGGVVEANVPILPQVQFPTRRESKETVKAFEDRDGSVVAVFDAYSKDVLTKPVLEQGTSKASLSNFQSTIQGTTRVDDVTGVVVQRTLKENNAYVFTLESKQQAGKQLKSDQSLSRQTVVELLK